MPVIGFEAVSVAAIVCLMLCAKNGVWLAARPILWIWGAAALYAAGLSITGVVSGLEAVLRALPW